MQTTRVFDMTSAAWLKKPRYISSCGGTRSGKTFSILQLLFLVLVGEERRGADPTINSIVSESMPHLKRGAIRDFKTILKNEHLWNESQWNATDSVYQFSNGSILEFFSADNAGKVYGSARDRLFINECQHIDYEIARQLFVRTKGTILLDYNPTHQFWAIEKIERKDNCITIRSTYKDNGFLSPEQIREIEDNKSDSNWWRVFGEGKVGTLDGLIYEFETIDALPGDDLPEVYGLDFGFTNDPTAIVHIKVDTKRKVIYAQQICYRTRMLNSDIIDELTRHRVGYAEIYADCAEPKSIEEIKRAGFNIRPCDKSAPVKSEKMQFQIHWLKGYKLCVTKDSLDLLTELRNYTWAKNADGVALPFPIDKFNHALDALRYGCWTKFGVHGNKGSYDYVIR